MVFSDDYIISEIVNWYRIEEGNGVGRFVPVVTTSLLLVRSFELHLVTVRLQLFWGCFLYERVRCI